MTKCHTRWLVNISGIKFLPKGLILVVTQMGKLLSNIKKIIVFENLHNTYHYGVYDKLPTDQLNGHILDVFSHPA